MTNERWRAEMPIPYTARSFGDLIGVIREEDTEAIVTRANAELDAAEEEKAALIRGTVELNRHLEMTKEQHKDLHRVYIDFERALEVERANVSELILEKSKLRNRLDAAEAREAALTRERDELKSDLDLLIKLRNELASENAKLEKSLGDAKEDYFRGYRDGRATSVRLDSELAARRASDPDVRECAESIQFYRPGAPEAASRLLAADWLKKEGGS